MLGPMPNWSWSGSPKQNKFQGEGEKGELHQHFQWVAVISWLLRRQLVSSSVVWAVRVWWVGGGCPRCLQDLSCSMSHSHGTDDPSLTWRELRETWLWLCTGNIDDGLGSVKALEYLVI